MSRKKAQKGVRTLTSDDDLYQIFGNDEAEAEMEEEVTRENFSELLEQSLADKSGKTLLEEKGSLLKKDSVPVHELIKEYPEPQAELDLHGCTAEEAVSKTMSFIQAVALRGMRTIRIIVGKGLHSRGEAVLPGVIEGEMVELKRAGKVLTFTWEKAAKRKSGALIVYLAGKR